MIGLKYMPKVTIEKITPIFDYPEELLKKIGESFRENRSIITSDL